MTASEPMESAARACRRAPPVGCRRAEKSAAAAEPGSRMSAGRMFRGRPVEACRHRVAVVLE